MKSDIVPIMLATISGELDKIDLEWHSQASVCVVMASGGYRANTTMERRLPDWIY